MKIRKIAILAISFVFLAGTLTGYAAPTSVTTNGDFADILIKIMEIKLPEGQEGLTEDEAFEVKANVLAENGVPMFVGKKPWDVVTYGDVAEILHIALIGPSEASLQEKMDYLKAEGYFDDVFAEEVVLLNDLMLILNIPGLSPLVLEGYPGEDFGSEPPEASNPSQEPPSELLTQVPPPENPLSPVRPPA